MEQVKLSDNLSLPRIVHGHWRLKDWGLSKQGLLKFTEELIELGISAFDHADIYGDYSCESLFGEALNLKPSLRQNIKLITKCGIKLLSNKFPERQIKHYDYSSEHIIASVENSLKNFNTDYIDLLLLHRPSPFFDSQEVAEAFTKLKSEGKVLNFGVSNFNPIQFELLNKNFNNQLVTNQIEISPYQLEHFENGNMDYLQKESIKPMAWSPFAGGKISNPIDDKGKRIYKTLQAVTKELSLDSVEQTSLAWLLNHPSSIIPIIGTGKTYRIKELLKILDVKLSTEQWFRIYVASLGKNLP